MEAFVKFPFKLYKDNPYWIPPIIKDELENFDKNINPSFEIADAFFYGAYKNGTMVGRVAVILNNYEINSQHIKKVRFGWFDFEDDLEISTALLQKVFEHGKANNLEFAEGPIGFTNLDKVGVLTKGYEELGTMVTWYNYPYYVTHLEKHGFSVGKEYVENRFPFSNVKPDFFIKAEKLIRERYKLKPINFTKVEEVMPYVDEMFDLFNATYDKLSSFIPVTDKHKEFFKNKYVKILNPEFIKFVVDDNNKLVAFGIVMPSFAKALQKAKGKLFPFGFLHFLKAQKKNDTALFYLIGILPEYQSKGVTAIIFNEYYKSFNKYGVKNCIRTPELASNIAIQKMWKNFDPEIYATRCTYTKNL